MFNARIDYLKKNVENDNWWHNENRRFKKNCWLCLSRDTKPKRESDTCWRASPWGREVEQSLTELENYSRQWNLQLYIVPEGKDQNVRQEVIQICQVVLPEHKARFSDVIDIVHRLSQPRKDDIKPRGIILQFTSHIYQDAVRKAAKKSAFLQRKKTALQWGLTPVSQREKTAALAPGSQGTWARAYFIGGRAFANRTELTPAVWGLDTWNDGTWVKAENALCLWVFVYLEEQEQCTLINHKR